MNKTALTLLTIFLISFFHLKSQWYFTPAMGYAIGVQGADYNYMYGNSMDDRRVGNISLSYHKGGIAKAGFGYFFNEYTAVEIIAGYQNSFKSNSLSYPYYRQWSEHRNTVEVFWKSQSFSLSPTIRLGSTSKHGPFVRIGPTFQYVKCRDESGFYPLNKNVGWFNEKIIRQYDPKVVTGIYAEAGFHFAFNEQHGLALSLAYQGLSYHPESSQITSYQYQDVEKIDNPDEGPVTRYEESVSVQNWEGEDPTSTSALQKQIALSSITMQVAFVFNL